MSIYAAETHDRTNQEEVLLSRLFGTLGIVHRDAYLGALLQEAGVEAAPGDLPSMQIQFWPELGAGSPDLILECESLLLFVSSAKRDEIDRKGLRLLAEHGRKLSPRSQVLLITEGTFVPPIIEDVQQELPARWDSPFRWISWARVYELLYRTVRERGEEPPARDLIEDLLGLLAAHGVAPFMGFDPALLKSYREVLPATDRLLRSVRLFAHDVETQAQAIGIRPVSLHSEEGEEPPVHGPRSLTLHYADESWDPGILSVGTLFLTVDYLVGEIHVGFRSNLTEPAAKALLVEGRSRIGEKISARDDLFLRLGGEESMGEPSREVSLLARLETQEGGNHLRSFELLTILDGTEEEVVHRTLDELATFRGWAADIPLLPLHRVSGQSPFVIATHST
jgi:hypothetical protein